MEKTKLNRGWIESLLIETLEKLPVEKIKQLDEKKYRKLLEGMFPKITNFLIKKIEREKAGRLKEHRKSNIQFRSDLYKTWKTAIDLLEVFILFNNEFGERATYSALENSKYNIKLETLITIQTRACQISFEILELIKAGFADGAQARWRSLYELSVLANFLEDKPEITFQKYNDYIHIDNYNDAIEYQKNCKKLGYSPLSKKELTEMENEVNLLKEKYGQDFVRGYGWAADHLEKGKRHFAGMEERVNFKYMRSHYKWANHYIHGGAKGNIFKAGLLYQNEILLAGPTNYGFADPGQNTAFCLLLISSTLCSFEPYLENPLFLSVAEDLLGKINQAFVETQVWLEEFERASRRKNSRKKLK